MGVTCSKCPPVWIQTRVDYVRTWHALLTTQPPAHHNWVFYLKLYAFMFPIVTVKSCDTLLLM